MYKKLSGDMMQCDMCGRESSLVVALVEGTRLQVCKNCARYGKVLRKAGKPGSQGIRKTQYNARKKAQEPQLFIVSAYSKLIKGSREAKDMNQEEFAKKLNEKVSVIHALESGKSRPSIPLAKKLEKMLNIKLIEEYDENETPSFAKDTPKGSLTIGDLIKVKK